ncbi:Amidase [Thermomonospora echinospora]|uniref:Amidase n=1 Tax=Thermomonospora echinospora TaxID=1992 RepID=A0A1H5W3C1_9ACTN|nr:Amidase [Thermomonospora echinospora]
MSEWVGRTATEIAAAVQTGQVTAREVVQRHLDRIRAIDSELGAFVRVRGERALAEADEVDARADRAGLPLAGVPVAIKDNIPVAGEPMRNGSLATPAAPQRADHPVVARLRAAGAVVVGLTNLPELAIYPFTDNAFGVARNPWDTRRTPGGSSGGAAVAVAAGMVPIAHGNDGAGSIRIPSANCGLFGIKPGPGVVPAEIGSDSWGGMSENGPLATTVSDAALALSVMADDPALAAPPVPEGLRIALSVKPPAPGVTIQRELRAAIRTAGRELVGLGHDVRRDDPDYPLWAGPAVISRWLAYPAADAEPYLAHPDLETRTRRHARAGRVGRGRAPVRAPRRAGDADPGPPGAGRPRGRRALLAAQRRHVPDLRAADRRLEPGGLSGRLGPDGRQLRGPADRRPARGRPRQRGPAPGPGRPAGGRPPLVPPCPGLQPVPPRRGHRTVTGRGRPRPWKRHRGARHLRRAPRWVVFGQMSGGGAGAVTNGEGHVPLRVDLGVQGLVLQ